MHRARDRDRLKNAALTACSIWTVTEPVSLPLRRIGARPVFRLSDDKPSGDECEAEDKDGGYLAAQPLTPLQPTPPPEPRHTPRSRRLLLCTPEEECESSQGVKTTPTASASALHGDGFW